MARLRPTLFVAALAIAAAGCGRGDGPSAERFDPERVPTAFRHASAALAWPGATRAFQVRADGSLYDGVWRITPRCTADGTPAAAPRAIAYEDRWCPVVHWVRESGAVRWTFEAVAFPGEAPGDTQLYVSLAVRARNGGSARARCTFDCALGPPPPDSGWAAPDAPLDGTLLPGWSGAAAAGWARERGADGAPHAAFELAPGASRDVRVLLAAYPAPQERLARVAGRAHAGRAADARHYWSEATARGTRFELGDPELETALRAARVVLLECRERHFGRWFPTGGPFQYRDTWLRDGARAVAALAVSGYTAESRALADGLALEQWPQGAFLSQRGQLDGNGQALWAFAQAELRPAPDSTLARFAEYALAGARWQRAQRQFGVRAPWPLARLLPYAEPHDGELVRAQLVGNDAWAIAGLESAGRLLHAAQRDSDAREVDALRRAHTAEFAAALAAVGDAGIPPSWQRVGRDWGNLAAGWPCRVLGASDPRLAVTAERAWKTCSLVGLTSYGAADSVHGYVGADLGDWALLAGRPADAERVLTALLLWRDATGASAELASLASRDYGTNAPPHPTCAAALLELARNMVIYDDADTLELTLGARERWWHGAHVRGAPTRWGAIDLAFERHGAAASWTWTPVSAWTRLTLPPGTVLAAAPAAPLAAPAGARTLLAPPGTGTARVALAPESGGPR